MWNAMFNNLNFKEETAPGGSKTSLTGGGRRGPERIATLVSLAETVAGQTGPRTKGHEPRAWGLVLRWTELGPRRTGDGAG